MEAYMAVWTVNDILVVILSLQRIRTKRSISPPPPKTSLTVRTVYLKDAPDFQIGKQTFCAFALTILDLIS